MIAPIQALKDLSVALVVRTCGTAPLSWQRHLISLHGDRDCGGSSLVLAAVVRARLSEKDPINCSPINCTMIDVLDTKAPYTVICAFFRRYYLIATVICLPSIKRRRRRYRDMCLDHLNLHTFILQLTSETISNLCLDVMST